MAMRHRGRYGLPVIIVLAGACGHSSGPAMTPPDAGGAVGGGPFGCPAVAKVGPQGPPACTALPAPSSLPPTRGVASGTRLVPRMLVEPVPGGVEVPWGTHDTVLDVDCDPKRLGDGTIRCAPSTDAVLLSVGTWFADAAHDIPVILAPLAAPPAAGTLVAGIGIGNGKGPFDPDLGCGASIALQRVGAAVDGTEYYGSSSGPIPVPSGDGMFAVQPEPAELAELHEVRTQLSGAIARREFAGSDGSRLFSGWLYDTAHDVAVAVGPVGPDDATSRLLPPTLEAVSSAHFDPGGTCIVSDAIFPLVDRDGCDLTGVHFARGRGGGDISQLASTADETIYRCEFHEQAGLCAYPSHGPLLGACATSPLSEWPAPAPRTIGARLTAAAWQLGDTTFVQPQLDERDRVFSDTTLGVDCIIRTANDGAKRCVPAQAAIAFSDPACTVPVVAVFGTDTPRYASQGSEPSNAFPDFRGQITVFAVGAPRTGAAYARTPEQCAALDSSARTFEVGAEIPASTFAAVEIHDAPPAAP